MPVVKNVWTDAAGVPLRNEWVMTTLISRAGWSKNGQARAVRVHSDLTDSTGLWLSPDLPPQSSYEEAGTYYRVECAGKIEYFDVPDTGGPYWLADRRRNPVPVDADWKVLAKLVELPDATALAGATEGQVPVYNATSKTWQPVTRVTAQQLADGLAGKAAKQYVDDANQALSNRASALELWKPTVDTSLAGKASTTSVTGLQDRTSVNESDITSLKSRIATVEGGGSGSTGAVQHGSLRYLATKADGTTADDHPQYLTQARGDARYYPKSTADATFAGLTHAARHATGGSDPITPAAIGASPSTHGLADHSTATAQPIQPVIAVPNASASASNKAHSMLITTVPTDNGGAAPYQRSVRQQIVHWIDMPLGNVDMGNSPNGNTVFYQDFVMRETGNIFYDVNLYQNLTVGGTAAAGTAGGGFMTVVFYDMTAGGEIWRDTDGYYYVSYNATYDFRPTTMASIKRMCGYEFKRGNTYRFQVYARKAVSASVRGWYARGGLFECVALDG